MKEHCAQCLTPLYAMGRQAPDGRILCPDCHYALTGPRRNGDRIASIERYRRGMRLTKRARGQRALG